MDEKYQREFLKFVTIGKDIQSWWEVPSIAHFCSLFRAAFNLLDFDIEELEEALLTDGTEDTGSSLLQELIVRLLCGCYGRNHGISIFNYQMFLRRLFRTKCREYGRENPFDSDVDFQFLPLRTKVEILQALCDFRLDADDVLDCLKNLESDSLRLQPLGYDRNQSAYWYFYGTRLYREDYPKVKKKETPPKRGRKRIRPLEPHEEEPPVELDLGAGVWQVVCYTEEDWCRLAESTDNAPCKQERTLHHVLTEDFLPEIPRLFEEKRNLQRKRLLEMAPRRQSTRIEKLKHSKEIERKLQKQKDEEVRRQREEEDRIEEEWRKQRAAKERQKRIENRERGSRSNSEDRWTTEDNSSISSYQTSTGGFAASSGGRKTNNSLSAAMGEITLPPPLRKLKSQSDEDDLRISMYKIMNRLKSHEDAWPFCEPVDESTAPNYYNKIKRPMDLTRMEEKLDEGEYKSFRHFRADFQQIVDNCRKYNGLDNEYTDMVRRLQQIFRDAVARYVDANNQDKSSSASEDPAPPLSLPSPSPSPTPTKGKRGRKKKIVLSPRSLSPTDEEEDKENEEKSGTPYDSIPSNSESEREREEVESIKSLSNEPKPPKRRRGRPSKERSSNRPKNSSAAIEALELVTEQTLKDINKWLDDTPRFSEYSNSASNSPSQILGIVEDYESRARIEAEYQRTLSKIDKIDKAARKEALQQKRRLMKEQQAAAAALLAPASATPPPPPVKKKREIQRTIERLQPGKSKGNLLNNTAEASGKDPLESLTLDSSDPVLSLGTVLTSDVIGFGIGPKQHSFSDADPESCSSKDKEEPSEDLVEEKEEKIEEKEEEKEEKESEPVEVKETESVEEKPASPEPSVSPLTPGPLSGPVVAKDTKPNFNAWFKAFGAPKVLSSTGKRKTEFGNPMTPDDNDTLDMSDLPPPTPGRSLEPRHRRLSTGSSVSERSSLSQEPDPVTNVDEPYVSPQQQPSPYHHSPSSVAPIKVGFYQDTFPRGGSDKSSSCSPRDPPSNQNSPHLQIVSPVQSPKEPNVYSNPMSPYVYDVPPPTPSYPSQTREVSYFDQRPPVYAAAPSSPPPPVYSAPSSPLPPVYSAPSSPLPPPTPNPTPTPTSMYPVKKRIYTDTEQTNPLQHQPQPASPQPLSLQHQPQTSSPQPMSLQHQQQASSQPMSLPHPQQPSPQAMSLQHQHQRLMEHYADPRFYPNSLHSHSPYSSEYKHSQELPKSSTPSHLVNNPTPSHLSTSQSDSNTPLNYSNYAMSEGGGYYGEGKPPSQYEHLMSHMSSFGAAPPSQMPYSSNSAELNYSMYLMQNKYKGNSGAGTYPPLSFNRPQVFPNPAEELQNLPAKKPPAAAKKPRKKKNQPEMVVPPPVTSISSGSSTAFQQYMGQNKPSTPVPVIGPAPPGYNLKDSYSYLEDMRHSGYYLSESASPNVKAAGGGTGSPFSFLPSGQRGSSSPNYCSLAQYQQYVQMRPMMLGYPHGSYLNMPPAPPAPHDRPPWGL